MSSYDGEAPSGNTMSTTARSVDRRNVLRSVGAGITLSPVVKLGKSSVDEVSIVTEIGRDQTYSTTVPKDWRRHVLDVRKVHRTLQSRFESTPAIRDVGRGIVEESIQDYRKQYVSVTVDDSAITTSTVPDRVNGVDVRVEQSKDEDDYELHACDNGKVAAWDPLRPGVEGGDAKCKGDGTFTTRLWDPNDDAQHEKMGHCAHSFNYCDDWNKKAYNACQSVGVVDTIDPQADFAIIDQSSNDGLRNGYSNDIHNEGWGPLKTHMSYSGVEEAMSSRETVYQMGISSCKTSGQVLEMDKTGSRPCADDISAYVHFDTYTEKGDSGGPHYARRGDSDNPRCSLIAAHSGSWDTRCIGCGFYYIHDLHDLYVY